MLLSDPLSVPVLFSGVIWVIGGFNQVPESSSAKHTNNSQLLLTLETSTITAKQGNAVHDMNWFTALMTEVSLLCRGVLPWSVPA